MKISRFSFIGLFLCALVLNLPQEASGQRSCATDSVHAHMMGLAGYANAYQNKVDLVNQAAENNPLDCATPLIIPVAVHFQNTGIPAACAIDMALDQIEILNEDFAATNSDINDWYAQQPTIWPEISNAESCIQFCLATSDHPSGFGLSEGDYAVTIDATTGDFNGAWSGYLNFWVRDISGGILGYSPLGGNGNGDGVACTTSAFSSISCGGNTISSAFNLGRTITHEVGHYLLLNHPWANGGCSSSDNVADTPVTSEPIFGCPSGQSIVNCTDPVLWPSYMDYCNDACLFMFSAGQVTRMENYVTSSLQNLLNNSVTACQDPCETACGCTDADACNYDATAANDDGSCDYSCQGCTDSTACNYDPEATEDDGSCVSGELQTFTMTVLTDDYPNETTWQLVDDAGTTVMSGGPYGSNATTYSSTEELCSGCYTLTISDSYGDGICCAYGEGNYEFTVDGELVASGGNFGDSESTEFCTEPTTISGCTDSDACNYDPDATTDDGSCEELDACGECGGPGTDTDGDGVADCNEVPGCTDPDSPLYNPDATDDDGTCDCSTDVTAEAALTSLVYTEACTYEFIVMWGVSPLLHPDATATATINGSEVTLTATSNDEFSFFEGTSASIAATGQTMEVPIALTVSCPSGSSETATGIVMVTPPDGVDCTSCPEDINDNGTVEVADVLLLLASFGCTSDCGAADIDGDGAVSVTDVLLLLAAFGEEC